MYAIIEISTNDRARTLIPSPRGDAGEGIGRKQSYPANNQEPCRCNDGA